MKPPEDANQKNEKETLEKFSSGPYQPIPEEESFAELMQGYYKQIKHMLVGDPVTHNASKEKTQQLNSIMNDPDAEIKSEQQDLKLEETFPKTILSIFSKQDKTRQEKFSDKLSNIYDINKHNKAANKNDPKL